MASTAAALTDTFVYMGIILLFYIFLTKLLKLATQNMNKPHAMPVIDDFYKTYGYTYDYVFVFNVFGEDDQRDPYASKYSMRNIIERLNKTQMETKYFYSIQRDEIYVKVRASPNRLKSEASRINYVLQLDPSKLQAKAAMGKKDKADYIWKPIKIVDEYGVSRFHPYDYIYSFYDKEADDEDLYRLYPAANNRKHIFRGVDRINLIFSIFQASTQPQPPGAGLNISKLIATKTVLACFPLHDNDELKALQRKWLDLTSPPWNQPVLKIKDYFGDRIGLYFLYLGHYVELLIWPAILGAITYTVRQIYFESENFLMPYYTAFMVIWSTFFIEIWKRKQSTASMQWGTKGFEDEEQDRPLFDGMTIESPIHGGEMTYFAPEQKAKRNNLAVSAVIVMIDCVIAIVAGIYIFQYFLSQPANHRYVQVLKIDLAPIIASGLNAVVIVVLNVLYQGVAVKLNDYENHRTDTQYEDALISKIFAFQLVNSFAALTFVAFVKSFIGIICIRADCTGEVAASLSTIFIAQLVVRALVQVVVRKVMQDIKERNESSGTLPGQFPTPIEQQYVLDEYPEMLGTLRDYSELVVQYGYTVLFVAAFPLAPTLAFVSSFIQIRIDGWKLCQAFRRPQPKKAEDIGVWQTMVEILSVLGVVYNYALIFFTGRYLVDVKWSYRWILFVAAEHATLFSKFIIGELIDDVPEDVEIQLKR